MEKLLADLSRLERQVEVLLAEPRLHRKDVQRLLGVSERTLSRRMRRADFPRPIYDAGRPKWPAGAFSGHVNGQDRSVQNLNGHQ